MLQGVAKTEAGEQCDSVSKRRKKIENLGLSGDNATVCANLIFKNMRSQPVHAVVRQDIRYI